MEGGGVEAGTLIKYSKYFPVGQDILEREEKKSSEFQARKSGDLFTHFHSVRIFSKSCLAVPGTRAHHLSRCTNCNVVEAKNSKLLPRGSKIANGVWKGMQTNLLNLWTKMFLDITLSRHKILLGPKVFRPEILLDPKKISNSNFLRTQNCLRPTIFSNLKFLNQIFL